MLSAPNDPHQRKAGAGGRSLSFDYTQDRFGTGQALRQPVLGGAQGMEVANRRSWPAPRVMLNDPSSAVGLLRRVEVKHLASERQVTAIPSRFFALLRLTNRPMPFSEKYL